MQVCVVPGPGNGQELVDSIVTVPGVRVRAAHTREEIGTCDVIVTPRGPSRSFSAWYRDDPLGRAVLDAYQAGTPWVALCGSALPLVARFGSGCGGIEAQSLIAAKGTNDRFFGQRDVLTPDGQKLPFHYTSAPSFEADGETEVLGRTDGEASVLREADLVITAGFPLTQDGWIFLFESVGYPLAGARTDPLS